MAVGLSSIEAVRVLNEYGDYVQYTWKSSVWYGVRDDRPHLDVLVRGHSAQSTTSTKLDLLADIAPEGARWQRWTFEEEVARERRFGEMSLPLKVPQDIVLRCYVVPTALLSYRDIVAMLEDIEVELGIDATWDVVDTRLNRSWSRRLSGGSYVAVKELVRRIGNELHLAQSIRRDPFQELGPRSRRDSPLPENAIVSHWAVKRYGLLQQAGDQVAEELRHLQNWNKRHSPAQRLLAIRSAIERATQLLGEIDFLKGVLSRLCTSGELQTSLQPGPIFLRDHRLRHLMQAFAPRLSESISTVESVRSHYPPISLNTLWELWGAVWLAKQFKRWGFAGSCFLKAPDTPHSCSWHLQRGDVVVELDYEAHPTFIDHSDVPPIHERRMPVLEWAAKYQSYDQVRPYFGSEEKCSPDYLIRITTPAERFLLVGDACLASPHHHALRRPQDAKLYTVEKYRQTIGWVSRDRVVRCHPMGGFVLFPPPSEAWQRLEQMPGVRDCTLLTPSPCGPGAANGRLADWLNAIVPNMSGAETDVSRSPSTAHDSTG